MRKIGQTILFVGVLAIIILVFAFNLAKRSIPPDFEEIDSDRISNSIKIYKDGYGIPSVYANSEYDVFFAIGYCQAESRMWQMDLSRRIARGELSEIFGEISVPFDKFVRSLDIDSNARKTVAAMKPEIREILQAYSDGVNCYIEHYAKKLPYEFGALDYFPGKWTPEDCAAIAKFQGFLMSVSFWTDIAVAAAAEKIGPEKALTLIPDFPSYSPAVLEKNVEPPRDAIYPRALTDFSDARIKIPSGALALLDDEILKNIKSAVPAGSNCWAISGGDSTKRKAVLANDPHMPATLPSIWFRMSAHSPDYNVAGFCLPGTPLFLIGRNDSIAWGVTNSMVDDFDFFVEKTSVNDSSYYFDSQGNKKNFSFVRDTIYVKNGERVVYYKTYAERSAVIAENPPDPNLVGAKNEEFADRLFDDYLLTFEWTGSEITEEFEACYLLNTSKNWRNFEDAVDKWSFPGLVFSYADAPGNIGIKVGSLIPKRAPSCMPNMINPGWLPEYEHLGYYEKSDLHSVFNPENNFVASANNILEYDNDPFVTALWEPRSRAERISGFPEESSEIDARESKLMQSDLLSPYSRDFLAQTLPYIAKNSETLDKTEKEAYLVLSNWDFIMSPISQGSAIFNVFFVKTIENTFLDELGEEIFDRYCSFPGLPTRKIEEILIENDSLWIDDVGTPAVETKEQIILASFRDAIRELKAIFPDEEIANWQYGKFHTLTLRHFIGRNDFFAPTVNIGPYSLGGSHTTVNCALHTLGDPYDVTVVSAARFIADMADTTIHTSFPGGSSGDPFSPNYANQVFLWLNNGYIRSDFSRNPGANLKLTVEIRPRSQSLDD